MYALKLSMSLGQTFQSYALMLVFMWYLCGISKFKSCKETFVVISVIVVGDYDDHGNDGSFDVVHKLGHARNKIWAWILKPLNGEVMTGDCDDHSIIIPLWHKCTFSMKSVHNDLWNDCKLECDCGTLLAIQKESKSGNSYSDDIA